MNFDSDCEKAMREVYAERAAKESEAQARAAAEFETRKAEMFAECVDGLLALDDARQANTRGELLRLLVPLSTRISKKALPELGPQADSPLSLEAVCFLTCDDLELCARVAAALAGYTRFHNDEQGFVLNGVDRAKARKMMPRSSELARSLVKISVAYARCAANIATAPSRSLPNSPDCSFARWFAALAQLTFLRLNGHARDMKLAELFERFANLDVRVEAKVPFDWLTGQDAFEKVGASIVETFGDVRVW